ncbi:hypothetical protein K4G60_g279 [Candida parapsilosis]|nr:hypothetical protein K4G60_g279 [Candida parapsilosis]KAI5907383.1 hypothetical protein K4G61_g1044 [Candida parapsilosis]
MSHDYSQDFIKLQLEEDAFFNQLSYGHINADRTIEVLRSKQQPQAVDLSNRLSCGNEKDQKKLSLDNEFQSIQLDWYTLHLNQLTALRAKINQQQLKAYNKSVDQFRKREIHWIQSYRKRKQLETKKRQKKLEDRTMRLEKIRQLKQRVRDVTKKMSVRMHNTCEGDNVERQSCWAKRLLALVWIGNYGKVTTYSNTSKSCQDQDDHTFTNNEAKIRDDPWYFRSQQAKATTTTTITTTSSFACELSSMHSNQIGQKQDLFTISIEKALPYVGAQVSSIQNQTTTNSYIIKALVHKQEKTNEETGD